MKVSQLLSSGGAAELELNFITAGKADLTPLSNVFFP